MAHRLLVRGARQLLTLRGPAGPRRGAASRDLGIIEDGAFLVEDGIVTHIGPASRVESLASARSAPSLEVQGRVVMPGFVDCHAYPVQASRCLDGVATGPLDSLFAHPPIPPDFWSALRALRGATTKRLTAQTRASIACMTANGTTTLNIHSGYGLDEASELKVLRIAAALDQEPLAIVATFHAAHVTPPEYPGCPRFISRLPPRRTPSQCRPPPPRHLYRHLLRHRRL